MTHDGADEGGQGQAEAAAAVEKKACWGAEREPFSMLAKGPRGDTDCATLTAPLAPVPPDAHVLEVFGSFHASRARGAPVRPRHRAVLTGSATSRRFPPFPAPPLLRAEGNTKLLHQASSKEH